MQLCRKLIYWALCGLGCFVMLGCLLGVRVWFPFQIAFYCLFGWTVFLYRKLSPIEVPSKTVVNGVIILLALTISTHFMMRQLYAGRTEKEPATRTWRFRWTIAVVGVVLLMFGAGIAAVGITHQSVWMVSSKERFIAADGAVRTAALCTVGRQPYFHTSRKASSMHRLISTNPGTIPATGSRSRMS